VKSYNSQLALVANLHQPPNSTPLVHRTTDGGQSWEEFSSKHVGWAADIEFVPNTPNKVWMLVELEPWLYMSADTGRTWDDGVRLSNEDIQCEDMIFVDNDHGWIVGQGVVYWTETGGGMVVAVDEDPSVGPTEYRLLQNYPNPLNPRTTIEFALPRAGYVTLRVYNILGEEVTTLIAGEQAPGTFKATWEAAGLPSGVYFYRLTAGEYVQTKKAILVQ
jgi:hypothetical protein